MAKSAKRLNGCPQVGVRAKLVQPIHELPYSMSLGSLSELYHQKCSASAKWAKLLQQVDRRVPPSATTGKSVADGRINLLPSRDRDPDIRQSHNSQPSLADRNWPLVLPIIARVLFAAGCIGDKKAAASRNSPEYAGERAEFAHAPQSPKRSVAAAKRMHSTARLRRLVGGLDCIN